METWRGILGKEDMGSERQGDGDSDTEIGRQGEVDSTGRWKQEEGDMEWDTKRETGRGYRKRETGIWRQGEGDSER